MFRETLLAATALVLGVYGALATEQGIANERVHRGFLPFRAGDRRAHGVPDMLAIGRTKNSGDARNTESHWTPDAIFNNFSKDKNAEFMSWYGFAAEKSRASSYISASSWFRYTQSGFNTLAIVGTGRAPKLAKVPGISFSSDYKFEVAILSSVGGLPGQVLATTSSTTFGDTALCCTAVRTVRFSGAPKLEKGTQYFVTVACANAPCVGFWNMQDTDLSGDTEIFCIFREKETYNFGTGTHTAMWSSLPYCSPYYPDSGAIVIK
jgi:hypothetical protein